MVYGKVGICLLVLDNHHLFFLAGFHKSHESEDASNNEKERNKNKDPRNSRMSFTT